MQVVNTVFTANLYKSFDLFVVSRRIYSSIYKPQRFSGLLFKVGKISITLFSNGKLNILGCKNFKECKKVGRKVATLLDAKLKDIKLVNIVASENIGKRLDLIKLAKVFRDMDRNEYEFHFEPELLAAFVWKMKEKSENEYNKVLTAMIFHTGKINYTGAKRMEDIERASNILNDLFIKHHIIFEQ